MTPRSTTVAHADHRHRGRVSALPAQLRWTERVVPPDLRRLPGAPLVVAVDGPPERWAVGYADATLLVDLAGTHELRVDGCRWLTELDDDGFRFGNRLFRDPATPLRELAPFAPFDHAGIELVSYMGEQRWTTVVQRRSPRRGPVVELRGITGPDLDGEAWGLDLAGIGTAVIGDRGAVAVAMLDRCLHIVEPVDEEWEPATLARIELPHEPYALTAVDDGFVVLSAIEERPPGRAIRAWRLHGGSGAAAAATWRTEVRRYSRRGEHRWTTVLPFAAVQPAIDLDGDRLAIVGRGVTVLERGAIRWLHPSEIVGRAAAWGDGSLALGMGDAIYRVDPSGAVARLVSLPTGAELTAPPGIATDGTLLLGCSTSILLAR